jgi:hypothetical protein
MNLTGVLDTFKGFFSRAFWFGNFLPVAIAAAVHGGLAAMIFGWDAGEFLRDAIGDKASTSIAFLAALIALAYMIAPLAPLFGGWLDGSLLWGSLRDRLRAERAQDWQRQDADYQAALTAKAEADRRTGAVTAALQEARAAGARVAQAGETLAAKEAAAKKAKVELTALFQATQSNWDRATQAVPPIDGPRLENVAGLVAEALSAPVPDPKLPVAKRLNDEVEGLQRRIIELLRDERREADYRLSALIAAQGARELRNLPATRLAEVRERYRAYIKDTYNIEFAYLWPRVRMLLGDSSEVEKGLTQQVADSASQVDFAVLLLALTVSVPAIWLPSIAFYGKSWIALLMVGGLSPLIGMILFEMIVQAEIAFGVAVETAVDRYRLAVLKALSMPRPATLSAERQLWDKIGKMAVPDARIELVYAAEAKP